MSVLFPAPFSPSRQWICPGSTTRSMWSLATRDPKRLVLPRSSSFTCDLLRARTPGAARVRRTNDHRNGTAGTPEDTRAGRRGAFAPLRPARFRTLGSALLRLRLRRDRDLAAGDVRGHLLQLVLDVRGHLRVEGVVRGEAGAVVLQGADIGAGGERARRRAGHVRRHGLGD